MTTRMTSARFVGRAGELAELEAALRDAAEGRPSLALVGGESGVGKSRLADELKRHARESGARVLSGDCVELGEDELPYAPLLSALRPLVRDEDPALDELAPAYRAAIDAIMPGLGSGHSAGDATQSRVFEALLALLESLGEDAPVVLVVEDLHWADSSTRSFIGFLARTVCTERLLLVGTYRSDELHRRHPLRPLLAELASDQYARLIELPRFTPEELAEQLEGILAGQPEAELVERIYSRSEGNALFAEEILAAGPRRARHAAADAARRPDAARRAALAAGAGAAALARVPAGRRPLAGGRGRRASSRPSCATRCARPWRATSWSPSPTRATASGTPCCARWSTTTCCPASAPSCTPRSRARSRSASRAASGGAHITAQAAHHWVAAGDQPRALAAAVRAALAAERVNAFGEAQALFERALGLWERVEDPEQVTGLEEVELLRRAAYAADQAGDPTRQEALLRRALEPRRTRRRILDWPRPCTNGSASRSGASTSRTPRSRRCSDGLALLPEGEQSAERAKLLSQLAKRRMLQARSRRGRGVRAVEAIAVARAVGPPRRPSRSR